MHTFLMKYILVYDKYLQPNKKVIFPKLYIRVYPRSNTYQEFPFQD